MQISHSALQPDTGQAAQLVAHRGDSMCFPENTKSAIEAALQCGAQFVEFDVQFTADLEAVLLHDADLQRITGKPGNVLQVTLAELSSFRAQMPGKFGDRFADEPIATLKTIVSLLREWPDVTAFVELKRASIRGHGAEPLLQTLNQLLLPIKSQVVLISFDVEAIAQARSFGFEKTGWVFDEWNDAALTTAQQLQPDYIFTDLDCIPDQIATNWQLQTAQAWQWALYETHDPQIATNWVDRGVSLIETDDISRMLPAMSDSRPGQISGNKQDSKS